jgi:diguanylate cyclase (GGDEF)-like protein/PAS domain S-box-containing protein
VTIERAAETPSVLSDRPPLDFQAHAWRRRHVGILCVLLAHVPALMIFGLARGFSFAHIAVDVGPILVFAALAMYRSLGPRLQSAAAAIGLMAAAAALVHLSDGRTEAHFLFFVLLGVLALYDDWVPYLAAVLFVLFEHGIIGVLAPAAVWGSTGARQSPWVWAAVHGGFVLAASVVALVSWRWHEMERAMADDRLRASEEHFRITFEGAPIGVALVDTDGHFLRVNPALCKMLGYPAAELLDTTFQAITHPDDLELDLVQLEQCLLGSLDDYQMVKRYIHKQGHVVWIELNVAVARDVDGTPTGFVSQILDITERQSIAASLAASELRFAALVEHGSDLISIADREGRLIYTSPAYASVFGVNPADRIGQRMQDHIHPDDRAAVAAVGLALAADPGGSATVQLRYAHANGSWPWVEATITNRLADPAVGGFVINTRDVTDRVQATERLAHQATHDALTGLPNRTLLEDRMVQARSSARRHGEILAAFFVDIDRFKAVNDTYGHAAGDLFLIEAADRLRRAARVDDTVARLGGDEFVVVACLHDENAARELGSRLCGAFAEPFMLNGVMLSVAASVGIATTRDTEGDLDLLNAADIALYEAKADGLGAWAAFEPSMRAHDRRREDRAHVRRPDRTDTEVVAADAMTAREQEQEQVFIRYQAHLAEATQALVVQVDGLIVAVSPMAVVLLAADAPADLIGRHVFEFVTPDSLAVAHERQVAIQTGGWPQAEIVDITTLDGRPATIEVTSTPAFWHGRLASQMTLRPVEDRWAEIVRVGTELTRTIGKAAIITDVDFKIVAWNDEAAELYGWSRDEVMGRLVTEVLPWVGAAADEPTARHHLQSTGRWEGLVPQARRDGSMVVVDTVAQVINDRDGNPIGVVSVLVPSTQKVILYEDSETLLAELDTAIRRGELRMAFQPIVDHHGHVTKVEALVRWHHPTRGLLLPDDFIPTVERTSLMAALTAEVLRQSCEQVARWRSEGMPQLEVAVNVSGRELSDPLLIDRVNAALDSSGLPASALWLEITETALAKDADLVGDGLARLCGLGIRIALDDFGTGFATLAQLHQFPAHALKIDRLFVNGIATTEAGDGAIVRSVLALGHELGLEVIAEGVETDAQRTALTRMGCELFQGYLFARPAFAEPAPPWLRTLSSIEA